MSEEIKISYFAAQKRVKVELTRDSCQLSEFAPADLMARARSKLEEIKYLGEIDFFVCYESRLQECWQAARALPVSQSHRHFIITIGAGCPILPGIKVDKGQGKVLAYLNINVSKEVAQSWRYEWFRLFVLKRLREIGITDLPTNAQLYAAFARIRNGERLERMPIGPNSALADAAGDKAFSIIANKQRQEIALVVRDPDKINNPTTRKEALQLVQTAVDQLSKQGIRFNFYGRDLLLALESAYEGHEALGVELPLVLLIAVGKTPLNISINSAKALNYPGCGKLNFTIAPDKMSASISNFHMEYYDSAAFQVNLEWITKEMRRHQIYGEITDDIATNLNKAINERQNLDGMLCNLGIDPVAGTQPYLVPVFRDATARTGSKVDLDIAQLDIREMQQRNIVNAGSIVATTHFKVPGTPGKNVLGEEIAPLNEELTIELGDGLERKGKDFIALIDGLPQIEGNKITLTKGLIHAGDVNLRSGNIRFAGPVEIKGSIDTGAIVETEGDLIVHGQIRSAIVRVKGNLTVKAGILTGSTGFVQVSGNLNAEFIEQSEIVCTGSLTVARALINSRVFVGQSIKITNKGGVCAGGYIHCKDTLDCGNLGFKNGASTSVYVGVDGRLARRVVIRSQRRAKVEAKLSEDRNALRELSQRQAPQMTNRHQEMKIALNKRLVHGRQLLERMTAHIDKAKSELSFNSQARAFVRETLFTSVTIEVGGVSIPITDSVAAVCIVPKKVKDTHFLAIEDVESKSNPDAEPPGPENTLKAS